MVYHGAPDRASYTEGPMGHPMGPQGALRGIPSGIPHGESHRVHYTITNLRGIYHGFHHDMTHGVHDGRSVYPIDWSRGSSRGGFPNGSSRDAIDGIPHGADYLCGESRRTRHHIPLGITPWHSPWHSPWHTPWVTPWGTLCLQW